MAWFGAEGAGVWVVSGWAVGEDDGVSELGGAAPEFAVYEVGNASEHEAEGGDGADDVSELKPAAFVAPVIPEDGDEDAEHAAVTGHTALVDAYEGGGIFDQGGEIVEEHVADAAAEDDAGDDGCHESGSLIGIDLKAFFLIVDFDQPPCGEESEDVGEAIVADAFEA